MASWQPLFPEICSTQITRKTIFFLKFYATCVFKNLIFKNLSFLHWVFAAACGLSLAAASRGHSPLRCMGFPLQWPPPWEHGLQARGLSICGSQALEHRLSSCGARASLLCSMWYPPRPGIKPVSPALAGGFLTNAPPGKPRKTIYIQNGHLNT